VPFRCVDEINQGMDEKNEMAVWKILFESAERNTSQVISILLVKH
jgi:chromosome segregation ATPase